MRVGQNPAKSVEAVVQPAKITAALITYIPTMGGYYAQSLDVLKASLTSMRENADMELDIMVFDNASCEEVRTYLELEHESGHIQYLILSEKNIGKGGAWNVIFGAAPGEYIAYADSDVYFYPDWLSPQIKTLEEFPNAGMVTGLPMLTPAQYSTATVAWAQQNDEIDLQIGRFLPWEDFWRHAAGLGSEEISAREFYENNQDYVFEQNSRRYYIGAAHFQFVARKSILSEMLPIPSDRPMGQVRILDERINENNYLRLCMDQWYVQHMGNTLPTDLNLGSIGTSAVKSLISKHPFWLRGPLRKLVQWVYDKSFGLLYRG